MEDSARDDALLSNPLRFLDRTLRVIVRKFVSFYQISNIFGYLLEKNDFFKNLCRYLYEK